MLKVLAPAKLNLVLEVSGRRGDGYHEISSIMQTVGLCDELFFEEAAEVRISCDDSRVTAAENLVVKAVELLRKSSHYSGGIKVDIKKGIPLSAGLGGGSSDAAATLKALVHLWKLDLSVEKLVDIAFELGSDVPFFLQGGTSLVGGRGEIITGLGSIQKHWYNVLIPELPSLTGKTGLMYSMLRVNHFTGGSYVAKARELIKRRKPLPDTILYNTFEMVVGDVFRGIDRYYALFREAGVRYVHLSGSGPALFSLSHSNKEANQIHRELKKRFREVYLVTAFNDMSSFTRGH